MMAGVSRLSDGVAQGRHFDPTVNMGAEGGGAAAHNSSRRRNTVGSRVSERARQEDCREYNRHLAEARRHDLKNVAATRALYLAGEDGQGRQLVVFSPDLIATLNPSTTTKSPTHSPPLATTPRGRNTPGFHRGSSQDDVKMEENGDSGAATAVAAAARSGARTAAMASGARTPERRGGMGRGPVGEGGAQVAAESSVESAAVASLLLYFVKLMDNVANREYVLLLCGGGGGGGGEGGGSSAGGWMTWGRFSLLGQMHSLLPRRYRKNLVGLVVLQPTPVLLTFFEFAKLFLSPKFYQKLHFCEGLAELQERFPRGIVENLPEGAVAGHTHRQRRPARDVNVLATGSSDDPGRGVSPNGDDERPSPVRVARIFGGGVQLLQGDDSWTPPPLPPPPLQSSPFAPSPPMSAGARAPGSGGRTRSHRQTLDRRFSSSSGAGPNTPSPRRHTQSFRGNSGSGGAASGAIGSGRSSGSGAAGGGAVGGSGGPRHTRSGTGSGSNGNSPAGGTNSTTTTATFTPATATTSSIVASSSDKAAAAAAAAATTPSGGQSSSAGNRERASSVSIRKVSSGDRGNVFFHSVPVGGAAGGASGGVVGARAARHGRDHHRRAPSAGDAGAVAGVCSSTTPGGGLTLGRGVSPPDRKPLGSSGRRASSASLSAWAQDRPSPRLSPRGGLTPRTPVRNAWGGSPVSGRRSGPPTPVSAHGGKLMSEGIGGGTVRKTPRGSAAHHQQHFPGPSAAVAGAQPVGGGGDYASAIAVAAGTGWRRSGFQAAASSLIERAEARKSTGNSKGSPKAHQQHKSPRHKSPKSPKAKRPADGRTDSWGSDLHERKSGATGDQLEGRKRLSYNARPYSRRNSHDSPVSTRSSANLVDSSLAALERELNNHSSRMFGSNAATATATTPGTVLNAAHSNNTTANLTLTSTGTAGDKSAHSTAANGATTRSAGGGASAETGVNNRGSSALAAAVAAGTAAAVLTNTNDAGGTEPADHPQPLRRERTPISGAGGAGFVPPSPSAWGGSPGAVGDANSGEGGATAMAITPRGGGSFSASSGGGSGGHHRTTSSRIGPGIQALMAAHQSSGSTAGAPTPTAQGTGSAGFRSSVTPTASGAGGRPGRGHRNDAGGMRQALLEHQEAMRKAAAAAKAAAAGGGGDTAGKSGAADGGEEGGDVVAVRRKVPPDPKGKVFGVPLVEVMRRTPGQDVPWVLKRFVGFLSKFGLDSVGLFRLAGDGLDRAQLKEALDHGQQVCWDPTEEVEGEPDCLMLKDEQVNMVAQLLKAFFRELPEPLVPFSAYGQVVAIAKAAGVADGRWVQAMKSILWGIPNANYNCLRFLFGFLRKVAANSGTNRMTSENLAIVWAPNLVRPQDDDPFAILKDLRFQIETVRWMVDCFDDLFDD